MSSPTILRTNPFDEEGDIRKLFEAHKRFAAEKYKTEQARRLYKALYTLAYESGEDFAFEVINSLKSLDMALSEGDNISSLIILKKIFRKTKEDYFFEYEKVKEVQNLIQEDNLDSICCLSKMVEEKIEKLKIKHI